MLSTCFNCKFAELCGTASSATRREMSTLKSLLTSAQKAYKAGEHEAALDCCKRALRTEDGEQSAMVHLTFAVCRAGLEHPGQQTPGRPASHTSGPHSHVAVPGQAVFTAQEEPEMAERAFGSALELEPDNGQAWKGMAALLEAYGKERADELLQAYEKLSELVAAGKLKGKASEWDAKLKAVQV